MITARSTAKVPATSPRVAPPQVATPQLPTLQLSTPQVATPQVATPQVPASHTATPRAAQPQATPPQLATRQVATPQGTQPVMPGRALSAPHTPASSTPKAHAPKTHTPVTHTPKVHTSAAPAVQSSRRCAFCGRALPSGVTARRQYCCERCRRQAQDRQRRLDRQEAAALRAPVAVAMSDPWERGGLWDPETVWSLSLLDADPCASQSGL